MKFLLFLWIAISAFAQKRLMQERVVQLVNTPSEIGAKELVTTVRTVADIREASIDAGYSSITMLGTADNLAFAEWLVHAIDKPLGWQPSAAESDNPSAREYRLPDGRNPVARVYYLKNTMPGLHLTEEITILRTVAEVQKVFQNSERHVIAFCGTQTVVDLAERMLRRLDLPAGVNTTSQTLEESTFQIPEPRRDGMKEFVRIYYLQANTDPKDIAAVTRTIRIDAKIQRMFWQTTPPAIVVRGSLAELAQAQQMLEAR